MVDPILKRALETWKEKPQMLVVVEEMAELTKEILKNINREQKNLPQIIEETADVEIMLEQLKENYKINEKVASCKAEKIKLIKQRLDEWDAKHKTEKDENE